MEDLGKHPFGINKGLCIHVRCHIILGTGKLYQGKAFYTYTALKRNNKHSNIETEKVTNYMWNVFNNLVCCELNFPEKLYESVYVVFNSLDTWKNSYLNIGFIFIIHYIAVSLFTKVIDMQNTLSSSCFFGYIKRCLLIYLWNISVCAFSTEFLFFPQFSQKLNHP